MLRNMRCPSNTQKKKKKSSFSGKKYDFFKSNLWPPLSCHFIQNDHTFDD